ncbi:LysE family translocator [Terasakiella pusilla]|jgi:RhtB (resistance to homoserine/threonine) family protein|uniref:LysE family translocator n=1 Tax=Terasakiella pusilla TaxID=64973 RepID=UPI00048B3047|nr:LysE family transporter [Terasakiella pusilla]
MELLHGLLVITTLHVFAIVSPGPEFLLISRQTLEHGKKIGLFCVLGSLLGSIIHIGYSSFGLAQVLSQSKNALLFIQLAGGGYLIYLGLGAMRARPKQCTDSQLPLLLENSRKSLRKGFLCNLLNPKAILYYPAVFTFVLSSDISNGEITIYGLWMMSIHALWFTFVVLILSKPRINQLYGQYSHWIDRILGVAMVLLGLKVIFL